MQYQVKQYFGRNSENELAEFNNLDDAKKFLKEKLTADALYKVKATYRIYHFDEDLVEEWNEEKWQKFSEQSMSHADAGGASSTGAKSQSNFRPTPLPTSPRPPGMPASVFKKDEEDKDKG